MAIFTISKYKLDKDEHIEDFERDTGIEVIDHEVDDLNELEDEFDDFQQMTYKQRKISNAKSEELYGMDNIERYEKMKSEFLKTSKNTDDNIIIYAESNIVDNRGEHLPTKQTEQDTRDTELYEKGIEVAKLWSEKSMIFIITPQDSIAALEDLWNKWNLMHLKHRRDSDMKSNELFSMTNKEHYEKLKSGFLKRGESLDNHETSDTTQTISSNQEKIEQKAEEIQSNIQEGNMISVYKGLMELESIENKTLIDESMIANIKKKISNNIIRNVNEYYDKLNDLPFFLPSEMEELGVYFNDPFYDSLPDNKYLDGEEEIQTKSWFDCYNRTISGFLNEDYNKYTSLWINKLNVLYNDYSSIKESGDINMINARKQSILELGWNPEIEFTLENRIKASNKTKEKLKSLYGKEIYNLSEFYNECVPSEYVYESTENVNKIPIFIVLSYSGNVFSKAILNFTKGKFSHSALGLDVELNRLYSYNLSDGGFSLESLERYKKKNSESNIAVMCAFVSKTDIKKIKTSLDYLIANRNMTRYSITNILGIGLNKDFEFNTAMICSQFVDRILKMVNIDYTHKPSGLVTPNDFYINKSNKIYKIYEGKITEYNPNKTATLIKKLQKNPDYIVQENTSILNESQFIESVNNSLDRLLYLNENVNVLSDDCKSIFEEYIKPYIDIYYYNEAKEFPVQFDAEGNLLIKNMKKLDFELEYSKSHKLLIIYHEQNNLEGMKYELSKLWFMNTIIEKKIYNQKISEDEKKKLHKARARILNDFNKYLRIVAHEDKQFNFTEYYNNTPFSDATIKIDKHTIKHGANLAKLIAGILV